MARSLVWLAIWDMEPAVASISVAEEVNPFSNSEIPASNSWVSCSIRRPRSSRAFAASCSRAAISSFAIMFALNT